VLVAWAVRDLDHANQLSPGDSAVRIFPPSLYPPLSLSVPVSHSLSLSLSLYPSFSRPFFLFLSLFL